MPLHGRQVLDRYATGHGKKILIDFGDGNGILVTDVTDLAPLADDIVPVG